MQDVKDNVEAWVEIHTLKSIIYKRNCMYVYIPSGNTHWANWRLRANCVWRHWYNCNAILSYGCSSLRRYRCFYFLFIFFFLLLIHLSDSTATRNSGSTKNISNFLEWQLDIIKITRLQFTFYTLHVCASLQIGQKCSQQHLLASLLL